MPPTCEALQAALIVTNVAPNDHDSAEDVGNYGRERLDQAAEYLAGRGLQAEVVEAVGQPAEAIVSLAEERNVDLIVVGMQEAVLRASRRGKRRPGRHAARDVRRPRRPLAP